MCEACAAYEVNGSPCCEACAHAEDDRAHALASGLLALVAVGYLAAIAIGIVLFKARPFVGGLAAIVAIVLGRLLQVVVRSPVVSRRATR